MNQAQKDKFNAVTPGRVRFEASLAGLTTFGLGGPAAVLIEPDTVEELIEIIRLGREHDLPVFILGGGSNVLFRDGGFAGLVIRLGKGFAGLHLKEKLDDLVLVEAGAAAMTADLVSLCRRDGLTGLEFLAGLPGRVGGALSMNAGAYGREIKDALIGLTVLTPDDEVKNVSRKEVEVSYRCLALSEGTIILSGSFQLMLASPEIVEAEVQNILARRRASQPQGVRSAGSVFKNPRGDAAGRLIDLAGLKGRAIGGAWISEVHANFIVHRGQARARDVLALMTTVQTEVKARFGVELEPEIKIVGREIEGAAC